MRLLQEHGTRYVVKVGHASGGVRLCNRFFEECSSRAASLRKNFSPLGTDVVAPRPAQEEVTAWRSQLRDRTLCSAQQCARRPLKTEVNQENGSRRSSKTVSSASSVGRGPQAFAHECGEQRGGSDLSARSAGMFTAVTVI